MKMTIAPTTIAFALILSVPAVRADSAKSAKTDAIFMNPAEIKWGDAPPDLPRGAQIAVLSGDPSKNAPFAVRLKLPSGYKIPGHWHTQDEHLTILSGKFVLHMGDDLKAPAHELGAGAYHFLPAKMHHAAETMGETILQLHGVGPFDIHYINPADNPNKAASK